jgi:glutamine synthetase
MDQTQLIPAGLSSQQQWASSMSSAKQLGLAAPQQQAGLARLSQAIEMALAAQERLQEGRQACLQLHGEEQAQYCCATLKQQMVQMRSALDLLETLVADAHWPIPKYRELLFVL